MQEQKSKSSFKLNFGNVFVLLTVIANITYLTYDREYWIQLKVPLYLFLGLQPILFVLSFKALASNISHGYVKTICFLLLANTAGGVYMSYLLPEGLNQLKYLYHVETIVLIAVPLILSVFVLPVFCMFLIFALAAFADHRARVRAKYQQAAPAELEKPLEKEADAKVYNYLRMVESVRYNESIAKSGGCSLCQKTFEMNDDLKQAAACGHLFHHSCVVDWFKQTGAFACPQCRGSLIQMPSTQDSQSLRQTIRDIQMV